MILVTHMIPMTSLVTDQPRRKTKNTKDTKACAFDRAAYGGGALRAPAVERVS